MKKSVCSIFTKVGFAALVLSLNFFAACEIGLGSSVDVEAPKIEFSESTVESGAVVRDAFAVFGNWNDDGSISSITATLKNLNTGTEFAKAGTVGDNAWNVSFNPDSESIPDGSYELSVVIKDSADHETKISRAMTIDNTPPLVVLSRPSTKLGATLAGADSFDSYGQKFTLEGKAADDNDVSLIEVKVYADAACTGNPLKTISLPNVPLTIETDVAEYSSTEPNDYSVIYGHVDASGIAQRDAGDVTRYCKLVVYDGAQRYPVDGSAQTEADKKGNSIDYYYLNSDISSLFTEGYKITELYHILNGTYTGNARTTSPSGVISLLNSSTKKITTGQFKINPDNSPQFKVSARDPLSGTNPFDTQGMTNNNNKLEIEITPGLDGHQLKPETIGIYLLKCNAAGEPENPDDKIWLIEVNQATADEVSVSGSIYKYKTQYNVGTAYYGQSGTPSYGLEVNQNYLIKVAGKDEQLNDIVSVGDFGFRLNPAGQNIDLSVTQPENTFYSKEDDIPADNVSKTIKNRFTVSGGEGNYTIYYSYDDPSPTTELPVGSYSVQTGSTYSYVHSIPLSNSVHPNKVYYKASDGTIESNVKWIDIKYDNDIPAFTTNSLKVKNDTWDPTVYYKDTTLKMSGSYTDANVSSGMDTLYYYVQSPEKVAPSAGLTDLTVSGVADDTVSFTQDSTTPSKYNFNFTVADYKDNILDTSGSTTVITPNILYIQAVDKVGHKSSVSSFIINVDTSAPELETLFYKVGDNAVSQVGSTVYANGSSSVTIYGNYNDIESGVNDLSSFALEGATGTTPVPLTATVTYSTSAITADNASSISSDSDFKEYSEYNSDEKKRTIRSFKAVFTPTSGGKLKFEGHNLNWVSGNNYGSTTIRPFSISVDSTVPKLSNISITPSNNTVAYKKTEGTNDNYYVDNTNGITFTFAGVATDNIGVDNVKLEIFDSGSTTAAYTETKTDSEWSFTGINLSSFTGTSTAPAKARITVTDVAGNTKFEELRLVFDTTAPKAMHWADDKNKDVYFRIGNANNDRKSTVTTSPDYGLVESGETWNPDLDEGVGSKYSFGSYGNDSTIELRGYFEENGSGLKAVHYKIFSSEPSDANISSLGSTDNPFDGDIPVIAGEVRRVTYNVNSGTTDANGNTIYTKESMQQVTSNFRGEIPGFNNTHNYLVLVAEDNVGHKTTDELKVYRGSGTTPATGENTWNSSKKYFALNKDTTVPTITSTSSTQATNGNQDIVVSGTVSDADAGVKSVTVSIDEVINSHPITYSAEAEKTNGTDWTGGWTLTIPAATFNVTGVTEGNVTVYATAKDNAGEGNAKTISAANVIIDKVGPELTIDTSRIKDADDTTAGIQVNGTIELKGTAYDTNGIRTEASGETTLKLYYTTATTAPVTTAADNFGTTPASQWVELASTAHASNWTFSNVDTTTIAPDLTAQAAWLMIGGWDAAGNQGYSSPVQVVVDQKTDRPVIKFNNLTYNGTTSSYILKFGTDSQLEGTISDDDASNTAVVTDFIISSDAITAVPASGSGWTRNPADNTGGNDITWSHTSYGTTSYNKISGSYTYTPPVTTDGSKTIYFLVKDNAGNTYCTENTAELRRPYQQYKQEDKILNDAVLSYNSDSTSPTIGDVKLQAYTNTTAIDGEVEPGTSTVVGGTKKNKIKFIVKASDANGIASMSLEYTDAAGHKETISTTSTPANGTFTSTTDSSEATWTTDYIDVSNLPTGSVSVAITANDQSGLFANRSPVFMVDNAGPSINISSPNSSDEVTGAVSIAGQATDSGGAGSPTIKFLIPTADQRSAAGTTATDKESYYKGLTLTAWGGKLHGSSIPSSFEYVFNGDTLNDNASLDIYSKNGGTTYGLTADTNDLYEIPIWFRSEDALGNVGVKEFRIKYNPDADKPLTEISYPSASNYETGKTYVTLGGSIRVSGSISIPSLTTTPEKVYIQIARESGTGVTDIWGNTDKTKAGTGTGNYGYTVKNISNVATDIGKEVTGLTTSAAAAWWGIEAVRSSNAWSFNLNEDGQLNPSAGAVNGIQIRACGVNAEGKMGAWSAPVTIHIDASAPEYSTKLYQFSGTPSVGTQTAEKEYIPGVFLKGQWYIGIHMTDDDKVTLISVKRGDNTLTSADVTSVLSTDEKAADIFIKLNNDSSQTYTVEARDNATGGYHYVYPYYEIKVDNIPPALSDIKSGECYPIEMTKQKTSNNVMTFGAEATDAGSGFSRLAYYFKRGDSDSPTIELPLPSVSDAANKKWTLGTKYTSASLDYEASDKLFGKTLTGTKTTTATTTTFTSEDVSNYAFIRKGGIVKMAGSYHLITGVSGNAVTVNGKIDATVTSAFFPAAFIVDNLSSEGSTWASGINTMAGDDGDGIVESVRKSGTTWTWDTSIYAGELDDGEVTLVCVAFDVAENCADKETKFMLANKTPRLSKLYLATDLNGDGKYSDDELGTSVITASGAKTVEKYYSAMNAGSLQEVFTVKGNIDDENNSTTDSRITMRDKLGMAFEFVSGYEGYGAGQGDLKYKLSVGSSAITDAETGTTGTLATATDSNYANTTVTAGLRGKKFLELTPAMFTGGTTYGSYTEYKVSGETGYNASTNYLNYLHITLWDSSKDGSGTKDAGESDEDYTNSNGIVATYKKYTAFGDQWTAFNIPLYMDLVDGVKPTVEIDNPVAVTHTTGTGDEAVVVADGHVDLKASLSALTGTLEFDSDDKVSGKFKFTGTINDDKRVSYINVGVTKKFSGVTVSDTRLATYSTTTGGFKVGTTTTDVVPGTTTIVPASATGLTFKILTSEFSTINGHTVTWELEVDSELVESLAQTDVVFTVTANDGTGSTDATHRVDIVPYITSLDRPDAKTNTHRSRRGKYQVVLGETINLTGWNLPGTSIGAIKLQVSGQQNKAAGTVKASINSTGKTGASDKHDISFTASGTSGYIKVVTSGVSSVNNFNTGNAMESEYSGDEWTDDVYLNVWKNDEYFYFSNDPISPSMDRIKYNNTNGDARYRLYGGWATQGSKFYASYPNTTGSGSSGNAPSPATGDSGTSTSSQSFGDPATFYDVAVVGQNRYNVLVDCWQGNTNGWGRNFVINYNGYYSHNGCATDFNNSNSNSMRHVIERMGGGGTAPDNADSSDGFDEIFNQFLNPRIAVYNGEAYITYYDRYAKCLKWAMSKPSAANNTIAKKYATEGIWNDNTYQTNAADSNNKSAYYKNGGFVVAGYDTLQSGGSHTNLNVGMWSDIAIDTTAGKPVIAYYDGTNRQLMIATSAEDTYPINTNSPVLTGTATSATEGNAWSRQIVTGSTALRLGEYLSLALDGGNNIHIACKGAKDGALYYVYGARTAYGTYTWTTVCVDKNGSPGNWTDIKLTNPGSSGAAAGPVISYYDPTNDASEDAIKVAYLESTTSNAAANWDNMTVPCNTAAIANRITLALDVTDGASIASQATTSNNSKLAIGYVSSRFDCVYLRKE